jgi:hypothetical protein
MLGYPSKLTLLGTNVAEICADPHDRDHAIDALGRLDAAHRSEVELRTRSGAIIRALDTCCVVRDAKGTTLHYQGCGMSPRPGDSRNGSARWLDTTR